MHLAINSLSADTGVKSKLLIVSNNWRWACVKYKDPRPGQRSMLLLDLLKQDYRGVLVATQKHRITSARRVL